MMFNNKRGQFLTHILIIFIMMVLFFMLFPAVDGVIDGVKEFAPDSTTLFLLEAMGAGVLIGLVRFVYNLARPGGTP